MEPGHKGALFRPKVDQATMERQSQITLCSSSKDLQRGENWFSLLLLYTRPRRKTKNFQRLYPLRQLSIQQYWVSNQTRTSQLGADIKWALLVYLNISDKDGARIKRLSRRHKCFYRISDLMEISRLSPNNSIFLAPMMPAWCCYNLTFWDGVLWALKYMPNLQTSRTPPGKFFPK